jgi:cytochrome oxidase Cu insertion factor (SCO1/SenC/PrrC family)
MPMPAEPRTRSRLKLLLIAAVCALPFAAAWIVYLFDLAPGTPSNYGELLPPQPSRGAAFEALRGKWVLVSFDAAACDAYCERKLYLMRQLRRSQGKNQGRIERLWVITDGAAPAAALRAALEDTRISGPQDAAAPAFPAPGSPRDHIYLIDPIGNVMMRFPRDPDPSKMLKDLSRLLKYSAFG